MFYLKESRFAVKLLGKQNKLSIVALFHPHFPLLPFHVFFLLMVISHNHIDWIVSSGRIGDVVSTDGDTVLWKFSHIYCSYSRCKKSIWIINAQNCFLETVSYWYKRVRSLGFFHIYLFNWSSSIPSIVTSLKQSIVLRKGLSLGWLSFYFI